MGETNDAHPRGVVRESEDRNMKSGGMKVKEKRNWLSDTAMNLLVDYYPEVHSGPMAPDARGRTLCRG